MKLLENRILRDAKVISDTYLDVDGFLDGQIDIPLITELATEICSRFVGEKITKILCAHDSGIAAATLCAAELEIPLVAAKKSHIEGISRDVYTGNVVSFSRSEVFDLTVSRAHLSRSDRLLIICGILSKGNVPLALFDIAKQAGSCVCGVAALIEKSFEGGSYLLQQRGLRVESLAKITSMTSPHAISFEDN